MCSNSIDKGVLPNESRRKSGEMVCCGHTELMDPGQTLVDDSAHLPSGLDARRNC